MPIDAARAKSLFLAASDLADPAQRAAFLERECGGDAELRGRVEALLRANDAAPLAPPGAGDGTSARIPERPGQTEDYGDPTARVGAILAGKYKLIEEIGEGGMGSVFMAQQTEPVKRAVAVKVIKAGMDSKAVLTRFEAERQALAMMDHPNIAKVLDAGTTGGEPGGVSPGRPFFVMELVKGVKITQFCDERKLTPRNRLELFVPVCQAIQHAHQKGVIHRDIKPSNVLVALYDDRPVPKVIDFGVAKAAGQTLTEKTLMTGFGVVVGTPEYMSPEQANLNNQDIDTRSDVYSLGVLLYELLTGTTPVDKKSLGKAALLEILRIVREVEAPRPSAKLSTIDTLPSVAANRGTEPAKLSKLMKGELDWLVLRALEKDRTRRYETANALSRDIQRYLADEIVEARPPSAGYRLKKFVRRHKGQVIAAGLVLLALVVGIIGTSIGLLRESAQRERAEAGEKLAGDRLVQVEAEKQKAEEEKRIAQAVRDFLQRKLLGQADSRMQADTLLRAGGLAMEAKENPTIRELLDRAAQELAEDKIEANFPNQPLLQAEILHTVGITYRGVGEYERAIGFLERSAALRKQHLGADHRYTLATLNNLALAYNEGGKLNEALALCEQVRDAWMRTVGADHPETLTTLHNLAQAYRDASKVNEAIALYEQVRDAELRTVGADHPNTLTTLHNLAGAYLATDKLNEAITLFQHVRDLRVKKLGSDHPDTLATVHSLARANLIGGRQNEAIALLEQVRDTIVTKFGLDHPYTLTMLHNLATAYWMANQLDKSVPLFEDVLKRKEAKLGRQHPQTQVTLGLLGINYKDAGRLTEAIPLLEEAYVASRKFPKFPELRGVSSQLVIAYMEVGQLNKAIALGEQVRDDQVKTPGAEHPDTLTTLNNLAGAYSKAKQLDKSVQLYEDVLKRQEAKLGRQHPSTQLTVANLGMTYKEAGRLTEAIPLLEEAHRANRKFPTRRQYAAPLLDAYVKAGRSAEAVKLVQELLDNARKTLPKDSPQLAATLAQYSRTLLQLKAYTDAEPLLRECLAIREQQEPDAWTTFNTQSMLGGALLGQKKYDEAEPLLLKGYEGMKAREKTIPKTGGAELRIPDALDRLIDLYTATNKPDEVKKWRAERAKYPQGKSQTSEKR